MAEHVWSFRNDFSEEKRHALMVSAIFVACAANAATTNRIDNTTHDLSNFHLKDYRYENLDYTTDNQGIEYHGVFDVFITTSSPGKTSAKIRLSSLRMLPSTT